MPSSTTGGSLSKRYPKRVKSGFPKEVSGPDVPSDTPPNTTNSNLLFLLIVFTLTLHCLIFFALLHCSYAVYILLHVFRIRCSTFRCVSFPLTSLHSPSIFSTREKGFPLQHFTLLHLFAYLLCSAFC